MLPRPSSWIVQWGRHICAEGMSIFPDLLLFVAAGCPICLNNNFVVLSANSIACFHLEEYEAAKQAFEAGASQAPSMTQFKTWIRKCQAEIEGE